jgi:chemotaxis protein methyltransferase CheR
MNYLPTNIELSGVCEIIAARIGLHFPVEGWGILRHRLSSAAEELGFRDMNVFIQWILSSELNEEHLKILASHLTVPETYFWREPKVFAAFTDNILPELIEAKKNGDKSIRIWSAGCSSGEEPYSIAIALLKIIPDIRDWNITIIATDINPEALRKAEEGIYGPWSFRNSPVWFKSRYFHHLADRKWEINPEIKKMVTFSNFNLIHENFLSTICENRKMDIIFCRNVLMYFTKERSAKVSKNFISSLTPEGWMIVSSCELSSERYPQFTPVNFPGAVFYRNRREEFSKCNNDSVLDPQFRLKNPEGVLNENKNSIGLPDNQWNLEKALSICNKAIESDKLIPVLYFRRASILQRMNKSCEAIRSLKQAVFIDPDYLIGHFTLGNIFIRQGNFTSAQKYFSNALELLNTLSAENILAGSEGFSAKYIRRIILSNLQTQESI